MKAGRTGFRVDEPSTDCSDNLVPPVMLLCLAKVAQADHRRGIYRIITDVHCVLQNTSMRLLTVKLPPRGVHLLEDSIFTVTLTPSYRDKLTAALVFDVVSLKFDPALKTS